MTASLGAVKQKGVEGMAWFILRCSTGFILEGKCKGKGKAILHTGLVTPWGFQEVEAPRISRLHTGGGKVVSPTYRPPIPPADTRGTHFR